MASVDPAGRGPDTPERRLGSLARLMIVLGAISLLLIAIIIWAPIDPWFRQGTTQAREVDGLFKFMLAASAVILVYVEGLTLAFALQYRRRRHERADTIGTQLHGNTRLETAWSIAPAILLVILAVISLRILNDEGSAHPNEIQVTVWGYQYGWSYDLPQYGVTNAAGLTLPVNRAVHITEHSRDVIHAFWIPEFRIQYDMVPGITTQEHFTPVETGSFQVVCTQFCGTGHSLMRSSITVGTQADFVKYLRANHAKTLPAGGTTAALIRQ